MRTYHLIEGETQTGDPCWRWWPDDRPAWRRPLDWLVRPGGWLHYGDDGRQHLGLRWPAWRRPLARLMSPTPVSLCGSRLVLFGWGLDLHLPGRTYLVVTYPRGAGSDRRPLRAYLSRNGTPTGAYAWLAGAPHEIRAQAATAHNAWLEELRADRERRQAGRARTQARATEAPR